jgi:tetratricopeptide (TPR) repeat protein
MSRRRGRTYPTRERPTGEAKTSAPPPSFAQNLPAWIRPVATPTGMLIAFFALLSIVVAAMSRDGYKLERDGARLTRALAEERHADAIAPLEAVVERYPGAWMRWTQLGDCYLHTNQPAKALAAYEKSLGVRSGQRLKARMARARFLIDPNDAKAESLFTEAHTEALDPRDRTRDAGQKARDAAEAYYYIGLTHMDEGNLLEAARFFQRAGGEPDLFKKVEPLLAEIERRLIGG